MKKLLLFIAVILVILSCTVNVCAETIYYNGGYHEYNGGVIGLKINGKPLTNLPMSPVIINQFTMVPVREVFEALGGEVIWNDASRSVEIRDGKNTIYVAIGDRNAFVNDSLVVIEEPQPVPMLIGHKQALLKTMVPVRFVAERLGYEVDWDDATRTVLISDKKETGTTNPGASDIPEGEGNFGAVTAKSDAKYDYVYISTKYGISPKIVRYTAPERIVIDFPDAQFISRNGSVTLNGNSVSSVRYSNHEDMARVVLDITAPTQAFVMSDDRGILIRAEKSVNDKIVYDAFSKRIYFDKAYVGSGKATTNGYMVNFTNLKLATQKITVNDSMISEIAITSTASGCSVTVSGHENLNYTAEKGFHLSTTKPVVPEEPPTGVIKNNAIVIDAGHGGTDPGAIGYNQKGEIAAKESHINLAIALLVGEKLKKSGYDVIYTRDDDTYITLKERADIANESECALFVSIHCNSIEKASINGTQVYYHPVSETGTVLAKNIYDNIVELTGLAPKKTQNGSHLYVIRSTVAPSALVETAFISNESDRAYLTSQKGQEKLAEAIYLGIVETLK